MRCKWPSAQSSLSLRPISLLPAGSRTAWSNLSASRCRLLALAGPPCSRGPRSAFFVEACLLATEARCCLTLLAALGEIGSCPNSPEAGSAGRSSVIRHNSRPDRIHWRRHRPQMKHGIFRVPKARAGSKSCLIQKFEQLAGRR